MHVALRALMIRKLRRTVSALLTTALPLVQVLILPDCSGAPSYPDYSYSTHNYASRDVSAAGAAGGERDVSAAGAAGGESPNSMAAMLTWAGTSVKQFANKLLGGGGVLSPRDGGTSDNADDGAEAQNNNCEFEGSQHGATLAALHRQTSASFGSPQQLQQEAARPVAGAGYGRDVAAPQDCFEQEAAFASTVRRLTTEVNQSVLFMS